MWIKLFKKQVELKLKLTRAFSCVLLFKKLKSKTIGTNDVERYAISEGGRRGGGKETRRKEVVLDLMRSKIRSAERVERYTRSMFERHKVYVWRRWGKYREVMHQLVNVQESEVHRTWSENP